MSGFDLDRAYYVFCAADGFFAIPPCGQHDTCPLSVIGHRRSVVSNLHGEMQDGKPWDGPKLVQISDCVHSACLGEEEPN